MSIRYPIDLHIHSTISDGLETPAELHARALREGLDAIALCEAQHETANPASGKVMQHVHMQHEGTLRQRVFNKGRFVDVELYAILRKDYTPPAGLRGAIG